MWIGDKDNMAQEADKLFMGNASGVAAEVEAAWIGDENGLAQLIFKGGVESGEIVFTESTVWTVPDGVSVVDIFCVGGGGGGGGTYDREITSTGRITERIGGGGGGGYTATELSVSVTTGEQITVVIGSGGKQGTGYWYYDGTTGNGTLTDGGSGGTTSVIDADDNILCSAAGGSGGKKAPSTNTSANANVCGGAGGDGGSGGGAGQGLYSNSGYINNGGYGGVDGADGGSTLASSGGTLASGGSGQGTTTRAFGEDTGTLYSRGGDGYDGYGVIATDYPDSGFGGLGSDFKTDVTPYYLYGDGADGIVIIRWKAQ